MIGRPGLAPVVDDALAQQQLGQPVPGRHQIAAHVLAGPHQIPRRLLRHTRHRHRHDLAQVQQPGQVPGVPQVGLDPVPARALQLRGRRHLALDPPPDQEPGQPEPRRTGLIGDRDRPRQRPDPRLDVAAVGGQPPLEQLTGPPVQTTPDHRACVHIQTDTRSIPAHWGLPHLWLYRPGPTPARQPTITCGEAPARTSIPTCSLPPEDQVCSHDLPGTGRGRSRHTCHPSRVDS
jgi:hypothetical protein